MAAKLTQAQFSKAVADELGEDWSKAEVDAVLETVGELLAKNLKLKRGEQGAVIPVKGIGRVTVKRTPAKPKRMGRNPATGEEMMLKPKPASTRVRISPEKKLRDALS
jgi:nucleoid DNA-binding protein